MSGLRKVQFVENYWHVVSDEREEIIGSLLYTKDSLLPWRAEYAPLHASRETWAVGFVRTEEEALEFLAARV